VRLWGDVGQVGGGWHIPEWRGGGEVGGGFRDGGVRWGEGALVVMVKCDEVL
jgi:hypothetical protein